MDSPSPSDPNIPPAPNPATPNAARAGADFDLFCLSCAYNLRGLPGDPIPCPECGYNNPASEAEVPAQAIRALVRRMESDLALSTLCMLVLIPGLPMGLVWIFAMLSLAGRSTGLALSGPSCCCLIPLVAGIALPLLMMDFRSKCGKRPGWFAAFVLYQLLALAMCALVVAPIAIGVSIYAGFETQLGHWAIAVILGMVIAMFGVIFVVRRLHGRILNLIGPLRRDIAIHLVRDYMRRTQKPIVKLPKDRGT